MDSFECVQYVRRMISEKKGEWENERRREKYRYERETPIGCLPYVPWPGHNLLGYGMMSYNQLSYTARDGAILM